MTRQQMVLLAFGGSAGLLLAAFAFQYLGGLAPCSLCIWQRWPHGAALAAGAGALVFGSALWPLAGATMMGASSGLAAYHTGVERDWWPGPAACAGDAGALSGMSGADLLSTEGSASVVLCDEVAWEMMGLSMASWNGLASLALAGIWLAAALLRR